MIGVNAVPPMPPRLEIEKHAALHVGGPELAFARLRRQLAQLLRELAARPSGRRSRITGTTRPFGVSAAKPMWK